MRNLKRTMAMIRSAFAAIVLIFLIASAAFSQSSPAQNPPDQAPPPEPAAPAPPVVVPKVQVFGGYSFVHEGLGELNAPDGRLRIVNPTRWVLVRVNYDFGDGWSAEGQYNAAAGSDRRDFSGRHQQAIT